MTRSTLRTERADKDAHRVMDGDTVVAMALRLTNNRWILCDRNGNRYPGIASTIQCDKPCGCLAVYREHIAPTDRSVGGAAAT